MGSDADAADNRWLRDAIQQEVPLIYFLGVAPSRYQAIFPTYVTHWDASALKVKIAFGLPENLIQPPQGRHAGAAESSVTHRPIPPAPERRYALRTVKQRLHQCSFREAVIEAYRGQCAFSGLQEPVLLDAAHIVEDRHEHWGQPVVCNGLTLSKVHHAAFDAHLIGVDPDYRIHVSDRLLLQHDGLMLQALKQLDRTSIRLPRRDQDHPSRERLEMRFAAFKAASA
jgi:putative restriction endonuclease